MAQPGRPFTPPPPPQQPPVSPPPAAVTFNQSFMQNQQFQGQISAQRQTTQDHLRAVENLRRATPSGGGLGGAPNARAAARFGVAVTGVTANGQADRIGLQVGDILLAYDGKQLKTVQQLQALTATDAARNRPVRLVVLRNDNTLALDARPGRLGITIAAAKRAP
jgi:S1-C subfamily serine protease